MKDLLFSEQTATSFNSLSGDLEMQKREAKTLSVPSYRRKAEENEDGSKWEM